MTDALAQLWQDTFTMLHTPRELTVSEWADANRILESGSSAEAGHWRTDRAPYQREVMDAFTQPGVHEIVVMSSSQVGKALDVYTPIPTPNGWTIMGALLAGDKVYDENGKVCTVTAATEYMVNHKCYEVVFSDGNKIVADAEHRWAVDCIGKNGQPIGRHIRTTEEMSTTFKTGERNTYSIPVAKALQCENRELPIPPYTLGAWLGDGNTFSANITQAKKDTESLLRGIHAEGVKTEVKESTKTANVIILDGKRAITCDGICIHGHDINVLGRAKNGQCAECQRQYSKKCQYGFKPDPVIKKTMYHRLREAGLIGNKHIPQEYLRAGIEQRFALLKGLMDTDGTCVEKGRCEITLKEAVLAYGVSQLLHSLGIKHTIKERSTVCTNKGKVIRGTAYRISFLAYTDTPVFTLERKLSRMKSREGNTRTGETESRRIVDIREVKSRPVRCITVNSESHLYLAGDAMIPTHNSEIELNMMGRAIDCDPGPMLYIQPTDDVAEDYSKRRIAPMIQACPSLRAKVFRAKGRDSGNTIAMKHFPGGSLAIIGANSPSDLASKPVRYIFMDEIDRFPSSAGTEGDPIKLAERRTETFRHNRKIVKTSTPTIKGRSKIERAYNAGTQEEWRTECPYCHEYTFITFNDIRFDKEEYRDEDGKPDWLVTNVRWRCPVCNREMPEYLTKRQNVQWYIRNERALQQGIRSFRLNAFMSPWSDWADICHEFLMAKDDPELLKVFHNTMLGEPWETKIKNANTDKLMERREDYGAEVPDGPLVLTMGVDTQDNRLEYEVVGWDREEQSWGIEYGIIPGRPDSPKTWEKLDELLDREWKRADGKTLRILGTFVDSGGHFTDYVYDECYKREQWNVWAIKGEGGENKTYVRLMTSAADQRASKFIVGVDSGKEAILYASGVELVGNRYMHYPTDESRGYTEEYFKGLLSERQILRRRNGQDIMVWEKTYERNEPLDCRNYARAIYKYRHWAFDRYEAELNGEGEKPKISTRAEVERRKNRHVISGGIRI